jgi:lauroyl/myristoyl acyltransferase
MRPNGGVRVGVGAAFVFVRCLERIFSPDALYRVLWPWIAARVAVKHSRPSLPLPGCLGDGKFQISKSQRRSDYLNTTLEFFPERLSTPKWRDRLEIIGLEYLEAARQQKRPVILAFSHFGPYFLLRYWLRAAGCPAATLVEGQSEDRTLMKRMKDGVSPFPEIPTAFHRGDQLRETIEFLTAGNPLLIAIDILTGKQMDVPLDEHWQFGMATGAMRMALRHGAELIPCSIIDDGAWRFRIRLGPPVPGSLLASGDTLLAGKHLLDAMLPAWRERPQQSSERLIKQFRRRDPKNNDAHEILRAREIIAG